MIYIKTSIEPENGEEFEIANISLMRMENTKTAFDNGIVEYRYNYGGSWKDREGVFSQFFWTHLCANENSLII